MSSPWLQAADQQAWASSLGLLPGAPPWVSALGLLPGPPPWASTLGLHDHWAQPCGPEATHQAIQNWVLLSSEPFGGGFPGHLMSDKPLPQSLSPPLFVDLIY